MQRGQRVGHTHRHVLKVSFSRDEAFKIYHTEGFPLFLFVFFQSRKITAYINYKSIVKFNRSQIRKYCTPRRNLNNFFSKPRLQSHSSAYTPFLLLFHFNVVNSTSICFPSSPGVLLPPPPSGPSPTAADASVNTEN